MGTSLTKARSSSRTPTNPSSSRLMSRELKRVGMTPRPRPERDFNFLMKPRMLSLATLRTMKPLQLNSKSLRRKSRRSRRSSTSRLLTLILRRDKIFLKSTDTINGLFSSINAHMATMSITIPEDKKKVLTKEIKAVEEKLEVTGRFKATVGKIEELVASLTSFDNSLKAIDAWKDAATAELKDIKEASGSMLPEDRVARTMDLQEDIAAKLEIIKECAATEAALLPQGDKVPAYAQAFKDELARITKYVTELQENTKIECDKYSNDVKFWAEYRTGIKEFTPWLAGAEKAAGE